MSNRGTTYEANLGQLATIASRFILALPRALELSRLDVKSILDLTYSGDQLASTMGEMLGTLANPLELPIHRSPRGNPFVNWPIAYVDERNFILRKLNPAWIELKECGESVNGYQVREQLLKENNTLVDCAVMDTLMAYPTRIPSNMFLRYRCGTRRIFFDGATVTDLHGTERSFFMQYHPGREKWTEDDFPLNRVRGRGDFTAVLRQ